MITYTKEFLDPQWYLVSTDENSRITKDPFANEAAIDTYLNNLKTTLEANNTSLNLQITNNNSLITSIETLLA